MAARTEIFSPSNGWNVAGGEWNDWVARYTIINPINAAIFQAKDDDDEAWSIHLGMNDSGEVFVTHRRPLPGQPKKETLIPNAIGQPFDVRVRDNGLDYEVYLNDQSEPFTTGQYVRNSDPGDNSLTKFRWGIYVGAQEVESEAMIFVSHATVNPAIGIPSGSDPEPGVDVEYGDLIAGWDTWSQFSSDRWNATDTDGVTAQAVGTHESGGAWINFNNSIVENGASSDGFYGESESEIGNASTSVANSVDGVTLANGFDGFIDFTLDDTTGVDRDLTGFHFDVGAFRPNAATDWELEILSGGDLTPGSVASGTAAVNQGPIQDDESISLAGLDDQTLDANGSVTFRLNFTGGGGDAGAAQSGHHLFVDNVGVTALLMGLVGDFDDDGDVDLADLDQFNGNIGVTATGDLAALDLNGNGTVEADDFALHYETMVETSNGLVGTYAGDINLDGTVDVLGDASLLVLNLGSTSASWGEGDLNGDGLVNVLGDASLLVANLGNTNAVAAGSAAAAVPEPTGVSLVLITFLAPFVTRNRKSPI